MKRYLLTISHVRVKESPSELELAAVLEYLDESLNNLKVLEWVYEIGKRYKRRHIHAIVRLNGRYKGYTSHLLNKKLFQIRWDLLKTPIDVRKARYYIRKDDPVVHR